MDGKWNVTGERRVYDNPWVKVDIVDVVLPDGEKIDHHVVSMRSPVSAGVVSFDPQKGVLLLWRHRFIGDCWGWEIPSGGVEQDERPIDAAERECLEETGWRPNKLREIVEFRPCGGAVDLAFKIYLSEGATWVGPGRDLNEAADVAWTPVDKLIELINKGEITDGLTLTALLLALNKGLLSTDTGKAG